MTRARHHLAVAALALMAALVAGAFQQFGLLTSWQERVFDRFFIAQEAPADIVIVAIDDESIHELGGWPLSRGSYALMLRNLGSPRAVAFDISFADPSPRGATDDELLASALTRSAGTVVLATQYDDRGGRLVRPLPAFRSLAQEGYANMLVDADGVARSFAPLQGDTVSIAAALVREMQEGGYPQTTRIHWRGPAQTFFTIPFIDVYRGRAPLSVFNGATVLVGATAKDLHDTLTTPVGEMSGVEAHANALATLEAREFFSDVPAALMLLLIALSAALAAGTILLVTRLVPLIALLAGELVAINLASVALFSLHLRLPTLSLSLAFILSVGLIFIYQYLNESREKRRIREMFQYYLVPEVIDELAEHPERLALGGQVKELTILFSDIRGFTSISEGLSPRELTHLINEYLTAMTDAIMAAGGLVDKYIGDAVMAFWGAPLENRSHAISACRGALAMVEALGGLNARLAERGVRPIQIGIGVSTGEVVVGNMGSSKRFNYTVMGDEVNFASRLEGLTKAYGVSVIVGERTALAAMGDTLFTLRELDHVMVKGKSEPRAIYELLPGTLGERKRVQLEHFAKGRKAYTEGRWSEAQKHFDAALEVGEDGPSKAFLERVKQLSAQPPKDWNGIWEFTSK